MNKTIKIISFSLLSGLILQSCMAGNGETVDESSIIRPDSLEAEIGQASYETYKASAVAGPLFAGVQDIPGAQSELCDVAVHRLSYDTTGGAGEAATSSGVFMIPSGEAEHCSGDRPVMLYAHGTSTDSTYDLSQFAINSNNPATSESIILLATYASQGYAVIAPNYAGYADSSLSYHPYLVKGQQSQEMIDILNHARGLAGDLGANLSDKLFISGLSQGGYVALETHRDLEAAGETVTASLPISGPYAMLSFFDAVFAGAVNLGSTTFAPLLLTAYDQAFDIYDDPSEVYADQYAGFADGFLPRPGGSDGSLPATQLLSGAPTPGASLPFHLLGFGEDHLLADSFRTAYLTDAGVNGANPIDPIRMRVKEADLTTDAWTPAAGVLFCGASTDPTVYFALNTDAMATHIGPGSLSAPILTLDLQDSGHPSFGSLQATWGAITAEALMGVAEPVSPGIKFEDIHGRTGLFCSLAGLGFFNSILAPQ